ncbi:amidohydrolase family protein [Pelosinus propionicus]|uniref:Predicted metal-dependent hydrolase, TIM-barrel fold n=1 Tax=Pelosinus propionicus DSM 13327 TaxID=1123291 RepID=A0A1I4K973_9FIRM|nr:amidohydrolase family protein [Pelosinus propionicus]SFL75123.1 Predicted metal-dependent hydrolase, TIM-barrel fold [Pelosinus propionicus DSM 13327]
MEEKVSNQVPFSGGARPPYLIAPINACDCHMHIYDGRFPPSPHWDKRPPEANADAYRLLQKRIGTTRTVVVTPSTYGIDNRCTLDAIEQIGSTARGVAVVDIDVSDDELKRLDSLGICGIRVNFVSPQSWGLTTAEMLETLAKRVSNFDWHVQILMLGDQIVAMERVLQQLPVPIVIDHLARIPEPAGVDHPAFKAILRLLDKGQTWVKLSGAYMDTKVGSPGYDDVTKVAQGFVRAAPERMVWGSDWPHPTEKVKPDDAVLFDLLSKWAMEEAAIYKILVENPENLYGFSK